jgi:membrane protein
MGDLDARSRGGRAFTRCLARAAAFARDLVARLDRARTLGLAAETAFWIFLSLVPLAAVAGVLAARLSTRGDWADAAPLVGSLPRAAQELLSVELGRLAAANGGSVGAGSAAVFVWLASTGVHSIFDALEIGAGVARPWWKKRLLAIGMCLVLPVVVALLAAVGAELSGAAGWVGRWVPVLGATGAPSVARRLAGFLVSAALVLGYVGALYQVGIPARSCRGEPILPGALLAVALELLSGFAYAFYVSKVGDGGAYLGGLAAIGVTMMGLYLFTTALLVGAVVNASLARGARPASERHDRPGA